MGESPRLALELREVVKRYGSGPTEVRALTDVSIEVAPGELVAIMGPSGCGKSTLLPHAAALEDPDAGQELGGGQDLSESDERREGNEGVSTYRSRESQHN